MDKKRIKTFVIDTNVFIHKPDAILSFRDNEIVVPLWVLEELDKLKSFSDERGRNARHSIRMLEEFGKHGDLHEGVKLDNHSLLKVLSSQAKDFPSDLSKDRVDNKILSTALSLHKSGKEIFFVSKDINARVKARALGIKAVDYEKQKVDIGELYAGWRKVDVSVETITMLKEYQQIEWNEKLSANEFIVLENSNSDESAIGRWDAELEVVKLVKDKIPNVSGVKPLNDNQLMAFNLLLDDSIALVSLVGKAGTGKTLLAIAAGLKKVVDDKVFTRVLVSRPVIPMGKDIGFLPGAKEEKLSHWMQPLFDNLDYIMSANKKENVKSVDWLLNNKMIEIEALTYIRGRSLPKQFIIIDEAQNLSPHEIKTVVSRAGEGTKVVLTGDPYQIDSPYLDSNSNGLTYLVESFKGQKIYGQVILDKSERSELAELAAELL